MAKDYIPRKNTDFNTFQANLVKMVVAKATTWNVPSDEVTALVTDSNKYGGHYKIFSQKYSRSIADVDGYNEFRKTYEADLRVFVNGFLKANKKVKTDEATALGIKQRTKRRKQRSKIVTAPIIFIESKDGLLLRFVVRLEAHYGKGSMHPECDCLELVYRIGNKNVTPKNAEYRHTSKKAHFLLEFDLEDRGKEIYVIGRWKNTVKDSLSGPWCKVVRGTIW